MARPARPWFRFYVEATRDPKMRRLTPAQRWLWVAILSAARESSRPGYLLVADGVPYSVEDLADYAGMPPKDVAKGVAEMHRLGMLDTEYDEGLDQVVGPWFVPAWADRQYESDSSRGRTAKWRRSDGGMTPVVTPPETEADTETDRESRRKRRPTESFAIDDQLRAWGAEKCPGVDLDREREGWLLWCASKGTTYADPRAGFQTWCRRAQERLTEQARPMAGSLDARASMVGGPARAVLGRGVDAAPVWELDDKGEAVAR